MKACSCGNVSIPPEVVTESSGRGFREGLINLTTANPATLNFLVTIFMAAHCGTRGGGGGFAQSRPRAAFSRPTWENFTFCQLLRAFSPVFPNVDYLIHASACVLCCNWGTSSAWSVSRVARTHQPFSFFLPTLNCLNGSSFILNLVPAGYMNIRCPECDRSNL